MSYDITGDSQATLAMDRAVAEINEHVPWQTIIGAATSLADLFFNYFTDDEKYQLLDIYDSSWLTHCFYISVVNTIIIFALLESGQLRDVRSCTNI